jgi:LacI family transcriptional regulator
MPRVGIAELVKATGLSRATIDRAINGRSGVHPRTRDAIQDALQRLSAGGSSPRPLSAAEAAPTPAFDLVMRVGRGLMEQVGAAIGAIAPGRVSIYDLYQSDHAELFTTVRALCVDSQRPLVLTAKNAEPLRSELVAARRRGKRIITLVSDLSLEARDAFVGIDNRMAGQTAAFLIGNLLRRDHGKVGVVLGDYTFSCHEDREIGFRSNLRASFPHVRVADVAKGEDSPEQTYLAVRDLLAMHPDLDGIYNVAGGNAGLCKAISESGRAETIHVVSHETNHVTVPLIRDGRIHYAIAQNPLDLMARVVALVRDDAADARTAVSVADFAIYTRFNLPSFGLRPEGDAAQ